MCGAANPAAARKLTAITTTLAVNTILAEADRRRRSNRDGSTRPKDGSWARTAASTLATRSAVVATRGETVDRSVLLEGVLLPVGLRRAPGDVRRGRWDGPARVAALIGAELNEGFDASGVERRSSRLVDAAIEVRTDDQFFEMARWRAAAAARRADVLARRGVNLLLCSERVDHAACDALTRRGVFVAELVPEEDIRSTLDACGGGAPATAATDDALATCDVVEAEMFAEQRLPGAPAPALYVRARGTYTALVRGPGAETSAHHKRLVERGLRVFAASLDRVEDEMNGDGEDDARVSLVPGCAAFEAAMCARLRDAVPATPRWRRRDVGREIIVRRRRGRSRGEGDGARGDARDVSRGARAVGAEHGGARENVPRGDGDGGGSGDRSTMVGWEFRLDDATRTFDRTNAKLPREALDLLSRASESLHAGGSTLVGRVSAASAPEATHPGTAAAILIVRRPRTRSAREKPPRVAFFARALDPAIEHAALEPSSATIGKILAALEAVETAIRIGETLPAAVRIGTRRSVVGARGRRVGGDRRRRAGSARRRKIVGRVGRRVKHERRRRRVGRRRGRLSVVGGASRATPTRRSTDELVYY